MPDVAIVTAMYGDYDVIRPQAAQDIDVEWICVTDDPLLDAPAPWRVVVEAGHYEHPCMSAKLYKMRPGAVVDRKHAIWIDANMEVTSASFAREALSCINDGVAVWSHPHRDCIYEEADVCIGPRAVGGKYSALPIPAQAAHYRREGHPEHGALFACGAIAWDLRDSAELGRDWLAECERWGYQDQISFPVVCRRLGVRPGIFPHPIERARLVDGVVGNDWMRIHLHIPVAAWLEARRNNPR